MNYFSLNPSLSKRWRILLNIPVTPLQLFQYHFICLVNHGIVQGREINLRGILRIMPHALADDRQRNVLVPGDARP